MPQVSPPLASLLHYGLRALAAQPKPWAAAAGRCTAVEADAAAFLANLTAPQGGGGGCARPDVVYLNPCLTAIRKTDRADVFLQAVARLGPISEGCFRSALQAATRRVVLRIPAADDALAFSHGVPATRVVRGGQSNYHVFDCS